MFAVAGAVFVTGSVVLELVQGYAFTGTRPVLELLLPAVEESFEMIGILLWMRALLVYMSRQDISLRVRLED